ncbi:alpha/beta fold hydrolase [Lactiplantibacillus garii]|uniref:Alpha/beta fold hydrolase n=1 Tax=Lactiplantibacillus garii TaxID=2306423 RepID=A0A426D8J6_9LACO|nr:alpha/beta hydrolase family protein [Lactiplantibacillus garii]RRK10922.1 alpha/beta fold hydrolase [Lactiplantibacillus garii]
MSIHNNNFFSNTLRRSVQVQVVLPEPMTSAGTVAAAFRSGHQALPTLWLLHGLGGDATTWLRETAIERLATQYRVAVVMPQTERGFYTDMVAGPKYWTFMTMELPERMRYLFPLSANPRANFVAGNSMGGYGALRWALTYPEKFAAVAALSPVTDLARFRMAQAAIMPDMDAAFDPQRLTGTPNDVNWLVKQLQPTVTPLRVLMTTGDQDMLRGMDVASRELFRTKLGDHFTWWEGPGRHDWPLWNEQLPAVMHWLVKGSFQEI